MGTKKFGLAEIVRSPLCWVIALVIFLLGTAQGIGADRLFLVDRTSEQACEQAASIAEEPIQTKMLQVADDEVTDRCHEPVNCSEICAVSSTQLVKQRFSTFLD